MHLEKRTRGIWTTADTYLAIQLSLNKAYNFKRKASCYIDDMVTSDFRFVFLFRANIYRSILQSYHPFFDPIPYTKSLPSPLFRRACASIIIITHTRDKPVHPYPIRSHYRFSPDLKGGRGSHKSALSLSL